MYRKEFESNMNGMLANFFFVLIRIFPSVCFRSTFVYPEYFKKNCKHCFSFTLWIVTIHTFTHHQQQSGAAETCNLCLWSLVDCLLLFKYIRDINCGAFVTNVPILCNIYVICMSETYLMYNYTGIQPTIQCFYYFYILHFNIFFCFEGISNILFYLFEYNVKSRMEAAKNINALN